MAKTLVEQEKDREKQFKLMMQAFSNQFPLDAVFDRGMKRAGIGAIFHLEIYRFQELRLIRHALEKIAKKMK